MPFCSNLFELPNCANTRACNLTFYETASGKINVIEIPSKNPEGDTVLCIHGLCCDARIFKYVGIKLSEAGYNVASMDLPGHGKSDGKRGDLDFGTCIESIGQIIRELKKRSSRVFLLAHSMGSTFALWYAHLFKGSVDGLILLCPYIRVRNMKRRFDAEPNAIQSLLLLLGRIFVPCKRLDITKAFPAYVKIGGDRVAWMMKDPIINFRYSYRYLVDVITMRNSRLAELSDIGDVPVLLLHGKEDRNVYPQVSEEFFKLLGTEKKDIKIFDCDHWFYDAMFYVQASTYAEESRMQVISSLVTWIRSLNNRK
jgi:lysophospholipase